MRIKPLDPIYIKGFNDGTEHGKKEAAKIFNDFLVERVQTLTKIEGIGKKTAWKVHKHLLDGMDNYNKK